MGNDSPKSLSTLKDKDSGQVQALINPVIWKQMQEVADTMIKSGAMPAHIRNVAQAVVVMQAGYEMEMRPMEAINSLYIVKGQTTIWGKAITGRFRKYGYTIEYKDEPNKTTVTVSKKDVEMSETYTFDEALKSGYTTAQGKTKFGWAEGSNRILKLRYGALNRLAKTRCAEVLGPAVGITEIYQDSPTIQEAETVMSEVEIQTIMGSKDLQSLKAVCGKLKETYKVAQIKPYFDKRKEELEDNVIKQEDQ